MIEIILAAGITCFAGWLAYESSVYINECRRAKKDRK